MDIILKFHEQHTQSFIQFAWQLHIENLYILSLLLVLLYLNKKDQTNYIFLPQNIN